MAAVDYDDEAHFILEPQPGRQTQFLATTADIAIYGGAAGGGKSYGLLLDAARWIDKTNYRAVIFRRNATQHTNPGGLWDETMAIMPHLGGRPISTRLKWVWRAAAIKLAHLERERTVYDHQGSQYAFIGYDELTHFTRKQFFYMISRNRSMCGIKPYIRATTNPDADSWVATFLAWWINDDGFADPERAGVLRWFVNLNDELTWADSREALIARFAPLKVFPKSVTFIPASIEDNKILMNADPEYLANLHALSHVERARLLDGNWKIRPSGGTLFRREWFEVVPAAPADATRVRYWDRAATEDGGDYTAGVKISKAPNGVFYVEHVSRFQKSPHGVRTNIKNMASADGVTTVVGIEQDPGQAGKVEAQALALHLAGFDVKIRTVTKDKVTRAKPTSAQAEAGNIKIVRGEWNEDFFVEIENFPDGAKDDQVDGFTGGVNLLTEMNDILIG